MNYEQEYKEALERARTCLNDSAINDVGKRHLELIFPELKESEDERSKKWILEYLYNGLRKTDEQFKEQFKSAIAWLEKIEPKEEGSTPVKHVGWASVHKDNDNTRHLGCMIYDSKILAQKHCYKSDLVGIAKIEWEE